MTPRFSIVTPVYDPPADVLRETIASVTAQTFDDWELCLVDDCSPSPHVADVLAEAAQSDARVRIARRAANGGIVAASNDALAMAQGEFVVLLDHDDTLHPEALRLVDEALTASPEADYLYSDEDKIDGHGRLSGPFYKPDWSPERFRTQMYTCHVAVLRRSLVEEVGGFDPAFEGSQDWDLALRVTERARRVVHVPTASASAWRPSSSATSSTAASTTCAQRCGTTRGSAS
jgi:O-antigen biosynthesis protein